MCNILVTSSGVCVLSLYAGKVRVGVAPRKLFQWENVRFSISLNGNVHRVTQREESYLVAWWSRLVPCRNWATVAKLCVPSLTTTNLISKGL